MGIAKSGRGDNHSFILQRFTFFFYSKQSFVWIISLPLHVPRAWCFGAHNSALSSAQGKTSYLVCVRPVTQTLYIYWARSCFCRVTRRFEGLSVVETSITFAVLNTVYDKFATFDKDPYIFVLNVVTTKTDTACIEGLYYDLHDSRFLKNWRVYFIARFLQCLQRTWISKKSTYTTIRAGILPLPHHWSIKQTRRMNHLFHYC